MSNLTHKFYKEMIETRLSRLNKLTESEKNDELTEYKTDFNSCYGGWNLYRVNKRTGGTCRGQFGFDYRKSTTEMLEYLNGLIEGILYPFRVK